MIVEDTRLKDEKKAHAKKEDLHSDRLKEESDPKPIKSSKINEKVILKM